MPLTLFEHDSKSIVRDEIGRSGDFAHTFGGDPIDFELRFVDAPMPLHLIYRIDLSDPEIPLDVPGVRWLPLLYCFNYGTECCYQVLSDSEVVLLSPLNQEHHWPPWDAPKSFPLNQTCFSRVPYDPRDANDALSYKGIFGWDELDRDELDKALILARDWCSYTEDGPDPDWTYEDVIRCMYEPPFVQGAPDNPCKNPSCDNRRCKVIATQDTVVDSELIWPSPYVQTIWEFCNACNSIIATNQSS